MDETDDGPLVLVVEDESDLADLYAHWLEPEYRVRVANDAESALAALDGDGRVSVVVLDRRLPDRSGEATLSAIRDREDEPAVAMVTAVELDSDALSMAFDDYLVKPVAREPLRATVAELLAREALDDDVADLLGLASKRALLEAERGRLALRGIPEYERLRERFAERWNRVAPLDELDGHGELVALCREFAAADGLDADGEG